MNLLSSLSLNQTVLRDRFATKIQMRDSISCTMGTEAPVPPLVVQQTREDTMSTRFSADLMEAKLSSAKFHMLAAPLLPIGRLGLTLS